MNNVALIVNYDKDVKETLEDLQNFLKGSAGVSVFSNRQNIPQKEFDLFIVLGGDGTMLGQARKLAKRGTPIAGIHCGNMGFLVEFTLTEFKKHWGNINKNPSFYVKKTPLLKAKIFSGLIGGKSDKDIGVVANDLVVTAGFPFRLIKCKVVVDGHSLVATYRSDGLIVSTPLGSTAHNLSAGGPIVHTDSNVICITPIAPHSLSMRSIVLGIESKIEIFFEEINDGTHVIIDGQEQHTSMNAGGSVLIERSSSEFIKLINPSKDYWDVLRTKMSWDK